MKFGLGRASYDASQEIRNKHLTREEGVALVRRFDGEVPQRYFKEITEYIGMIPDTSTSSATDSGHRTSGSRRRKVEPKTSSLGAT